jgi:hypothetical protein
MAGRPLLTLALALFFAMLVPLALACEVSAQSHASCMAQHCGRADESVHCASQSALSSASPPKGGGNDLPAIAVASLTATLAAIRPLPHPSVWVPSAGEPPALPRLCTLLAQAVLLRI